MTIGKTRFRGCYSILLYWRARGARRQPPPVTPNIAVGGFRESQGHITRRHHYHARHQHICIFRRAFARVEQRLAMRVYGRGGYHYRAETPVAFISASWFAVR